MANSDGNKPENEAAGGKVKPRRRPDLAEILGKFSDAWSFMECGAFYIENQPEEDAGLGPGDGMVCLRHGLALFSAAYDELDFATTHMHSFSTA